MAYTWKNINYSVLPWYDNISRQQHRKSYAQGQVWPLIAVNKRLPPFQIIKESFNDGEVHTFNLVSVETGQSVNILSAITAAGLSMTTFATGDYDIISYPALSDMDINTPEGQYYAEIGWGVDLEAASAVSEVFCIKHDVSRLLKISFWHDEPFIIPGGHISYADPFYNFIYLDTEINRPEYPYEEEISERDGYRFPIHSVSKKTYFFKKLMPEYMIDLVRLIPQHHFVTVAQFGITYDVTYIAVNPQGWVQMGHLNNIEFEFDTDTSVQVTGKIKPESEGFSYDQEAYDDSHL